MKSSHLLLSLTFLCAFSLVLPCTGLAHNADVSLEFSGVGTSVKSSIIHEDADPFKGWLNLTVTNTGTEAWGDFHFQIFNVPGSDGKVVFDIAVDSNTLLSSQTLQNQTFSFDHTMLDFFFYDDPILAGETAWFSVYTDNTYNNLSYFGVAMWPTPAAVPLPGAAWLLGCGIVGIAAVRRKVQG
jgi:hypothetical protein